MNWYFVLVYEPLFKMSSGSEIWGISQGYEGLQIFVCSAAIGAESLMLVQRATLSCL